MSLKDDVDLLRKVPLFSNIELSRLKLLAFASERLEFDPGQPLFQEGEEGDAAYVIIEGVADVFTDAGGRRIAVAEVTKNDFIGEIAILCRVPRTATVVARSRLLTLKITKDLFFKLATEFPQMAVEVMRILAERLHHTTTDLTAARAELARVKSD